jgi:hypothetical protein
MGGRGWTEPSKGKSFPDRIYNQNAHTDKAADSHHGVANPKSESVGCWLKSRQEAKRAECGDEQKY